MQPSFFSIAATYTPVHIIQFRGWMRWGVLVSIWTAATAGMILKLTFIYSVSEWLSLTFYLGLGCAGLFTAFALHRAVGLEALIPIVLGALAYTIGALVDVSVLPDPVPGLIRPHEVFHLFVLAGVASHWCTSAESQFLRQSPISTPDNEIRSKRNPVALKR